ncbi:MAG: BON domain-containing protein [Pseudomonadota bacterium]
MFLNTPKFIRYSLPRFAFVSIFCGTLCGCAGVLFGGAVTGATVANDTRTTGSVIEDQAIELKAYDLIWADPELKDQSHISTTSYNQIVLLTGQAPTEELRNRAEQKINGIEKVRFVHNEIAIAAPSSFTARSSDSLLTAKVKTKLIALKEIDGTKIKVVTENGVVYLMGLITGAGADNAATAASTVSGVQKVVKLFEAPHSN